MALDAMEREILASVRGVQLAGSAARRLPNTSCLLVEGVDSAGLLQRLDLRGFAVSSGSACASGSPDPSHVLLAMGVPPALAHGAIRISTGWATSPGDLVDFAKAFREEVASLRRMTGYASE